MSGLFVVGDDVIVFCDVFKCMIVDVYFFEFELEF